MKRMGLFGGTFDPPHNGHLHIAKAFADELALDSVVFIPAGTPYHKAHALEATPQQRLAMVERAIAVDDRFSVSNCDILRPGATYSFDTVSIFRQVFPQTQLWWLLGMDSLLAIPTWHRYQAFLRDVNLAVAMRPSAQLSHLPPALQNWLPAALTKAQHQPDGIDGGRACLLKCETIDISSTQLRDACCVGQYEVLRKWVPAAVADYIKHEHLYQR
ncbi:nicotinate-nucleotide adenylyltransferase [Neisseriaceae bacterium ESL0693]|nr:nicotinate-nucleotide adenylyltransferase [Neisseriaceae bacterium ESL0693]